MGVVAGNPRTFLLPTGRFCFAAYMHGGRPVFPWVSTSATLALSPVPAQWCVVPGSVSVSFLSDALVPSHCCIPCLSGGCLVLGCGSPGLFSSVSASGVCIVLCHVCRFIYGLSYTLPGASPRALFLGVSYSSGLRSAGVLPLAPPRHTWLVEVCLCMVFSCKAYLLLYGISSSMESVIAKMSCTPYGST